MSFKDLRGSICKIAKHLGKTLSDDVIDNITEKTTFSGMKKTYQTIGKDDGEEAKMKTGFGKVSFLRKGKMLQSFHKDYSIVHAGSIC